MQEFKIGDKVKIKAGTTAKVRKSSMIHWQLCPELDGITFTIKTLTKNKKGCAISDQAFDEDLYSISFRHLEPSK